MLAPKLQLQASELASSGNSPLGCAVTPCASAAAVCV